ncbi:hypothetical protein [Sphingobacterium suaedae]|uniref:Outer membrane protein beta-barrel domain-containing protein n=1 Tax=Sphingobacterium suaedae TaxID=1686402 RepID=A0ABW5KIW4_9SPHI
MKNAYILLIILCVSGLGLQAQDHTWAFGFYGDVQMESPNYNGAFGIQGKYDVANRSALQAQVYGRNGYVAVGADYLFSFLDKTKHNFNVFLGAGVSQDFYRYNEIAGEQIIPEERDNHTVANGQLGVSYYFPAVNLSLYTGYKAKYHFDWDEVDANFLMFGIRYHLW